MNKNEALDVLGLGPDTSIEKSLLPTEIIKKANINYFGEEKEVFVKTNADEVILKSHLIDIFDRGETFKIDKTGKEIKEKLVLLKQEEEKEKIENRQKLISLREKIGVEPDQEFDEWTFNGLKDFIPDAPKRYSYDMIYDNQEEKSSDIIGFVNQEKPVVNQEKREFMRDYNEQARKCIKCAIEVIKLNTLINNLKDSQKYKLQLNQASILGF